MNRELRAHPRLDVRLSADVAAGANRFTATTRNLSAGGGRLESAHACSDGGGVGLSLVLVSDGVGDGRRPARVLGGRAQWPAEADVASHSAARVVAGIR